MENIFFLVVVVVLLLFLLEKFLDKKMKRQKNKNFGSNEVNERNVGQLKKDNSHRDDVMVEEIEKYTRRNEERCKNDSVEFRKIYNLAETTNLHYDLYDYARVISSTNIKVTSHESKIVGLLIKNCFFDRRCVFLDSYFKTRNGRYAQVDVIAVNRKGVFVMESKDYSGWIFGNGNQQMWTQSFVNKDKFRFYNPIKQNYNHIQCLKEKINKKGINFYSVIIFGDEAELKNISYVPKNAFIATTHKTEEMMSDIMKKEEDCLSATEIIEVCRLISQNKIEPTEEIRNQHIENIKDTTGEDRVYS